MKHGPEDREEHLPTRASLLQRLKNWDDSASWKDFFTTYWKLIYGVARKAGLNDAEAQDVVQETIIGVAHKMPSFQYDPAIGSFKGWLMKMTDWRIADQFRKKMYACQGKRFPREEALDEELLNKQAAAQGEFDFEAVWDNEWKKHILNAAMERVKQRATPRQFQIFFLNTVKNMPAAVIAKHLGISLPSVYFAKHKIAAQVKKEIRLLQQQMT